MKRTFVGWRFLGLVALLVAAVSTVSITLVSAEWIGSWGETSRALDSTTTLTYPAVSAIAAWVGSAPIRRKFDWLVGSASRSALSIATTTALALLGAALLGFLAVALCANALTATQATYGRPDPLTLLPVLAGFCACVGWGQLMGSVLKPMLAPLAALASIYVVQVLVDPGNPAMQPLAGLVVADSADRTYQATAGWMLSTRGVWLAALACLFLIAAARAWSRWFLPFCVACLSAVPLLLAGQDGFVDDPAASALICHHPAAAVEVCLTAARDHTYPEVWAAAEAEFALLDGIAPQGLSLVEEVALIPDRSSGLVVPLRVANGVNGNAHVVNPAQLQAELAQMMLGAGCRTSRIGTDGLPVATGNQVIHKWLLESLHLPIDGSLGLGLSDLTADAIDYGPVRDFEAKWMAMSREERKRWFEINGHQVLGCTLTGSATQ